MRYSAFICHQKCPVLHPNVAGFEGFIDLWLQVPIGSFCICTRLMIFAICQGKGQVSYDLPRLGILISSLIISVGYFLTLEGCSIASDLEQRDLYLS